MALTIISNPTAVGAQGSINSANSALSKTIKQLSTGLRINSSADDASGLAISEKLRGQISGLKASARNTQDAISYLQTAEVAIDTMNSMVQRIREVAIQAGDPAYTSTDRAMLQTEVDGLIDEVNSVSSSSASKNTYTIDISNVDLASYDLDNKMLVAIGANEGQTMTISIPIINSATLNLDDINVITIEDSQNTITRADQALDTIKEKRSILGVQMNILNNVILNSDSARGNLAVAESRIRDLDIAEASTMLASQQVMLQSATSMLAQANQFPSYVLQLLG